MNVWGFKPNQIETNEQEWTMRNYSYCVEQVTTARRGCKCSIISEFDRLNLFCIWIFFPYNSKSSNNVRIHCTYALWRVSTYFPLHYARIDKISNLIKIQSKIIINTVHLMTWDSSYYIILAACTQLNG